MVLLHMLLHVEPVKHIFNISGALFIKWYSNKEFKEEICSNMLNIE